MITFTEVKKLMEDPIKLALIDAAIQANEMFCYLPWIEAVGGGVRIERVVGKTVAAGCPDCPPVTPSVNADDGAGPGASNETTPGDDIKGPSDYADGFASFNGPDGQVFFAGSYLPGETLHSIDWELEEDLVETKEFIEQVQIPKKTLQCSTRNRFQRIVGALNNQGVASIVNSLSAMMVLGNETLNARQFDGLRVNTQTGFGNVIDKTGDPLSDADLIDLESLIQGCRPDAFVASRRGYSAIYRALCASGCSWWFTESIDGRKLINGRPILFNDFTDAGLAAGTHDMYAVRFGEDCGLFAAMCGDSMETHSANDCASGCLCGGDGLKLPSFDVVSLGEMQNQRALGYRVALDALVAVGNRRGVARLANFTSP